MRYEEERKAENIVVPACFGEHLPLVALSGRDIQEQRKDLSAELKAHSTTLGTSLILYVRFNDEDNNFNTN
ncbi:hypothetical protein CEXT_152191 [Caerostris extrusa]|uniref:Uncharacterized protein n=1 Tax=Caerostris extrusa TaxID=172846 RepID=A0AAV4MTI5_CAEEX|nr:hypothetical protein CEXT_152191 [Caerostris extrusa]